MIRTVDTDVFLLSISLYDDLNLEQLWIDFGSGKQRCFLPIHDMVLEHTLHTLLATFGEVPSPQ